MVAIILLFGTNLCVTFINNNNLEAPNGLMNFFYVRYMDNNLDNAITNGVHNYAEFSDSCQFCDDIWI